MSGTVILQRREDSSPRVSDASLPHQGDNGFLPTVAKLESQLTQASKLIDDIILKKYLYKLTDLPIIPLDKRLRKISDIRLFKITEMVYQKDEYSTYKFASVFSSVQNLNCGVFIVANSDGKKTDFYMGVRSLDDKRTTKSLKDTLRNALIGQFPGVKTENLLDPQAEAFLAEVPTKNIASVSCVANNKDDDFKDNETFIQGLEKLSLAMQGQKYTAIILAKSTPPEQLDEIRQAYETIYTQLSPFANMQLSYGTNTALSISNALSHGTTTGASYTENTGTSHSKSITNGTSASQSTTQKDAAGSLAKTVGMVALSAASLITAPLTGGASLVAAGTIAAGQIALSAYEPASRTAGHSQNRSVSKTETCTEGKSVGTSKSTSHNKTQTQGTTSGKTETMQLTMQNKGLQNTLERIDLQLKRLNECESLGMWECAAYFLSDSQETAEMAAGTYKALMKGAKSGVETSAINYWGRQQADQLPLLRDYITNFIHPVFAYVTEQGNLPVTASSLVSSNELAIQMGLPRKSVCGFPVIEHADFGKEVVSYNGTPRRRELRLGNIFAMGTETATSVNMDINSLTMHTFVTGSTGSGKSNTVYGILEQLRGIYNIPFLVIEPAKGEYKNVFGNLPDVSVYGTNPRKTDLLKINPFSFPQDVHVLEHMDRLVEIFNVCWPMYAAMPAILKEGIERAYVATGWDLVTSQNKSGPCFPNFADVLEQIEAVIKESKYSADSKGDYSGALLTRVCSLTTGLNRLLFCSDDIPNEELFDQNVIVDLSRVGSTETKSLIMGLLVMKLNEYRMASGKSNSDLSHITVLEEAHNLLKQTSTGPVLEGANLAGKSVEMLANSIAEMRTYGEGFMIVDQSPGLLDMSVIRNTNTKIVLRLPDRSDRELVGYAAGLNREQIDELSKLKRGVAAVYQNDWIEPVLVQVHECSLGASAYHFSDTLSQTCGNHVQEQLLNFLLQGRIHEKLDFSIKEIENGLGRLALSTANTEFVKEQLAEYKESHYLTLWSDKNFPRLARHLTDILGARARAEVENCVLTAASDDELTEKLRKIVLQFSPESSEAKVLALSQCLMKDMSAQPDEHEIRVKIYNKWGNHVQDGGTHDASEF